MLKYYSTSNRKKERIIKSLHFKHGKVAKTSEKKGVFIFVLKT